MLDSIREPQDVLMAGLIALERRRTGSRSRRISPSQAGDCRRRVWLNMTGQEPVNQTKRLPALIGTGFHALAAEGLQKIDPSASRWLVEQRVQAESFAGLVSGQVDCYDTLTRTVIDWKTTKKASLGWLSKGAVLGKSADKWPSAQQLWQVQLYGWLLAENGHDVERVCLVGVAKDGDEDHLRQHVIAYDPAVAHEALEWIATVSSLTEAPAPEEHPNFCRSYCSFYTADGSVCSGRTSEQ